jgi:hypothetical protein
MIIWCGPCEIKYEVDSTYAGQMFRCPSCKREVKVPDASPHGAIAVAPPSPIVPAVTRPLEIDLGRARESNSRRPKRFPWQFGVFAVSLVVVGVAIGIATSITLWSHSPSHNIQIDRTNSAFPQRTTDNDGSYDLVDGRNKQSDNMQAANTALHERPTNTEQLDQPRGEVAEQPTDMDVPLIPSPSYKLKAPIEMTQEEWLLTLQDLKALPEWWHEWPYDYFHPLSIAYDRQKELCLQRQQIERHGPISQSQDMALRRNAIQRIRTSASDSNSPLHMADRYLARARTVSSRKSMEKHLELTKTYLEKMDDHGR